MSQFQCYIAKPAPTEGEDELYWHDRNYFHPETGEIVVWGKLPPGALVEHGVVDGRPGPDGKQWNVKCPDGYPWHMNGPTKQGGYWTITGEVPNFTATPSIHVTCAKLADAPGPDGTYAVVGDITLYHGFLAGGVLSSTPDSPC